MKSTFASANLQTKVAILAARWCGIWGLLVLASYLFKGADRALEKLHEFAFATIVALGWRHVATVLAASAVIFAIITGGLLLEKFI